MEPGFIGSVLEAHKLKVGTGHVWLIRSHSSARFCFELSGNSNKPIPCNSNFYQNFELEISLN